MEHVRKIFAKWLVEQQTRFDACLVWVAAENTYIAALARAGRAVQRSGLAAGESDLAQVGGEADRLTPEGLFETANV